jgi:hypothetical protein
MNSFLKATALALLLSGGALSPALAADSDAPASSMGMMGGGCTMMGMMGHDKMGRGMMMPGHHAGVSSVVEGRLAYLKSELGITDAQAAAWSSYADAVRARVEGMQGMHMEMMNAMQKGGAIDRMDARIKGMEAMLETMRAIKPATEGLYAVLTAEQKVIADDLIGSDCGAM